MRRHDWSPPQPASELANPPLSELYGTVSTAYRSPPSTPKRKSFRLGSMGDPANEPAGTASAVAAATTATTRRDFRWRMRERYTACPDPRACRVAPRRAAG